MLCILISENVSRSLILNNMRAKVEFGTPEKARVKFPHSLILHFAFSSWIEKIMTKTRHCHWENRSVLQQYGAVRKFYFTCQQKHFSAKNCLKFGTEMKFHRNLSSLIVKCYITRDHISTRKREVRSARQILSPQPSNLKLIITIPSP